MNETDSRLADWAIRQAKTKYADEVSLLLEYSTYRLEDDRSVRFASHIVSDADPYVGMARAVIIGGLGYDFFQLSWDSFEQNAEAKGCYLCILAEADILYTRTEADRQRFLELRQKLKSRLSDREYMYLRGLEWINEAMEIFKLMQFEADISKLRKASGFIADYLAISVVRLNQTYFKGNSHISELKSLPNFPNELAEHWEKLPLAKSAEELISLCRKMIAVVREFFRANSKGKPESAEPDCRWLAEWYQECCYYFRKLYRCCAERDLTGSYQESCGLQADMDDISAKYGISGLDILSKFDSDDLQKYADTVKKAELKIVSAIEESGVKLDAYADVADFLSKNP